MTSDRIKEIQLATAYPNSVSVYQALLTVWNECEQEHGKVNLVCVVPKSVGCDRKPEDVCEECEGCRYLHQTVL